MDDGDRGLSSAVDEVSATDGASVFETHISVVVLMGDRAYKFPKPVTFAFLDQSTPEQRESACAREVAVNRRLAPDVYLGTGTVQLGGETLEHCVVMRRMPTDRRLSALLAAPEASDQVRAVARRLAAFHAAAERSSAIEEAGAADTVARLWSENLVEMRPTVATWADPSALDVIGVRARRYIEGRARLFEARRRAGYICDGHGDLLADDIFCLEDGPRILDGLAFADRFRHGDVLLDLAMLAMDLERLGAPELSRQLVTDYVEFSGEHHPASLAHHYIAYRALVRAKIAGLRVPEDGAPAASAARGLLDACLAHLARSRVRLVVVGGAPGTGKSTLARAVGGRRGWTVLNSDEVRKEAAGRAWADPAGDALDEGLYSSERTEATYRLLLARAGALLEQGVSVVLDASWSSASSRVAARRLAVDHVADLTELHCVCDQEVVDRRVAQRTASGADVSDADVTVARAIADRFEPWPEAEPVDTAGTPDEVVEEVLADLGS